ncbi:MAG: lamin tail domain-containing protein [Myxococcales bacterium]|nr:lamin tail domain-containing protein [Myxococcales bacterium]
MDARKRLWVVVGITAWLGACGDDGGSAGSTGGADAAVEVDSATDSVGNNSDSVSGDTTSTDADSPDAGGQDTITADVSDSVAGPIPNVVINELVHTGAENTTDWIELKNLDGVTVDLTGWGIRDHLNAHEFLLPEGTTIPAFGYLLIWGKGANFPLTMDYDFDFDAKARLFDPQGVLVDTADWEAGDAPKGTSWGRWPDGTGGFMTLPIPSAGKANIDPANLPETDTASDDVSTGDATSSVDVTGEDTTDPSDLSAPDDIVGEDIGVIEPPIPLAINEIYVSATPGDLDWVELVNLGDQDMDLGGFKLTNDSKKPFSSWDTLEGGTSIAPGQYLVLFAGDAGVNASFSFELSQPGSLILAMPDGTFVGAVQWSANDIPVGKSFSRIPNGTGAFQAADPTPEEPN